MKKAPAVGLHRCVLAMAVGDGKSVTGVTVGCGVAVTVNEVGAGGDALPALAVAQPAASRPSPISSAAVINRRRSIASSPSHRSIAATATQERIRVSRRKPHARCEASIGHH